MSGEPVGWCECSESLHLVKNTSEHTPITSCWFEFKLWIFNFLDNLQCHCCLLGFSITVAPGGGFWVIDLSEGHRINFRLWAASLFYCLCPRLILAHCLFFPAHTPLLSNELNSKNFGQNCVWTRIKALTRKFIELVGTEIKSLIIWITCK